MSKHPPLRECAAICTCFSEVDLVRCMQEARVGGLKHTDQDSAAWERNAEFYLALHISGMIARRLSNMSEFQLKGWLARYK